MNKDTYRFNFFIDRKKKEDYAKLCEQSGTDISTELRKFIYSRLRRGKV